MAIRSKCPICGEDTFLVYGKYPRKDGLCKEHSQQLFAGEIKQCDKCDKWHKSDEICECQKKERTFWGKKDKEKKIRVPDEEETSAIVDNGEERNNVIVINEDNKSKCITCGKDAKGLLFCVSCYHKYSKKELLFKITNCSSVELLDEDYEGRYTCKDGHIVKSKSERDIDNYLFDHDIPHAYEKVLPYGPNSKEILHPDFYLPHYLGLNKHVYIEHWGYNENNIQYTKTKKFKMPIYEKLGITLVCTYEKDDAGNIDAILEQKLNKQFLKENEINFATVNDTQR